MIKETRVENGWVRGVAAADPRVISYKGIPFAAPPVGALRWRAPQPAKDWEGVLDCVRFAPISMQCKPGTDPNNLYTREWNVDPEIPMDEDSLYLNIWTPAKEKDERMPVFVWYFGGGLMEGNPAEMEFNGERIARRGIVVVTINYRLNVFGFLAHPELTAEAPDAPTNFGLLDQAYATKWVKRNIAAFGGDPENITIGGQSAGGRSVQVQLTSPQTEGLFQKAIIMSGIRYGSYQGANSHGMNRTLEQAEADGLDFFQWAGIRNLAEARQLESHTLMELFRNYAGIGSGLGPGTKMWAPVIDGTFQLGHFSEMILKNKRHMVPLLMTNTSSESWEMPQVQTMAELETLAKERFGHRSGEFLSAVQGENLAQTLENAKFCPMELGMRLYFEATAAEHPELQNYSAVFDGDIPGWDHPGTFHSSDLWFVFESLASCWRPFTGRHYDLARQMCSYVSNFIKTGDPNGKDVDGSALPEWKSYSTCKGQMRYATPCKQLDDLSVSPVMRFLTDFYLHQIG